MKNGYFMRNNCLMMVTKPAKQKGLTLIEIMIALLLGAFLIAGIMQIFINTRVTYRMQEALSRLQENGRFAMDYMGRDIRDADYVLCPHKKPIKAAGIYDGVTVPPDNVATVPPTRGNGAANGINQDDPDSIIVKQLALPCASVAPPTQTQYTIITAGGINELRRNGTALIEGVENMQIEYGYDTNNDNRRTPNYFTPWTGLNLDQIVAVRVSLLLYTTDDNVLPNLIVPAFQFNNENIPASRRLRRIFTSTFALRNRIP